MVEAHHIAKDYLLPGYFQASISASSHAVRMTSFCKHYDDATTVIRGLKKLISDLKLWIELVRLEHGGSAKRNGECSTLLAAHYSCW